MKDIQDIDTTAFEWLRKLNPKYWSIHVFDKFIKYDHTTNNINKSRNAWISKMRNAPIITLVEYIRKRMMRAINDRKINCSQWKTDIPSFINNKMNQILKKMRKLRLTLVSEVSISTTKSWVINLQEHTCDCRLWQISGVCYSHAMPCIAHVRDTYDKFVAPC